MGKRYILTIDSGTTNTRVTLLDNEYKKICDAKREIGVRNTAIDGNNLKLKNAVKECIEEILSKNGMSYESIKLILASGMITSNVGLVEIPHLVAPVGVRDLAGATHAVKLPEIPMPIYFIPGVKNNVEKVNLKNFGMMDIMRGEEVESVSLIERYFTGEPLLIVLPGSHNKFVKIGADGKIAGCLTSISGELLSAITTGTIIADAVGRSFVSEESYDPEMLVLGYKSAEKDGLARACFSGRILSQFAIADKIKIANYILGAVLQGDVFAAKNSELLLNTEDIKVIVAGKNPLRSAIAMLMRIGGAFENVIEHAEEGERALSTLGACIIADMLKI